MAYLARGNLALSVAMTMASTFAAIALTPVLTGELAGAYVESDRWNLFRNMVAIVLVPVIAGTLISETFPKAAKAVSGVLPLIAIIIVVLIVGGIVGGAKELIREHAGELLLATFLLHGHGPFQYRQGSPRVLCHVLLLHIILVAHINSANKLSTRSGSISCFTNAPFFRAGSCSWKVGNICS